MRYYFSIFCCSSPPPGRSVSLTYKIYTGRGGGGGDGPRCPMGKRLGVDRWAVSPAPRACTTTNNNRSSVSIQTSKVSGARERRSPPPRRRIHHHKVVSSAGQRSFICIRTRRGDPIHPNV